MTTKPDFAPGDRVLIVGDHPWATRSGTIAETRETSVGRGWAVEIDGELGRRVFAEDGDLTRIGKRR